MTVERKGTSPLALLADGLPVRSRIGLAVLGADLVVNWLKSSPNFTAAHESFDLVRRWFDGERFDPDQLEDSLDPPLGDGPLICELHARSEQERAAWLALIASVVYTTYHAVDELGEDPSQVICEVDETALDELDAHAPQRSYDERPRQPQQA